MFEFQGRCPYCSSDRGFFAFGVSAYTVGEYDYSKNSPQEKAILQERRKDNPLTEFSLAGTCIACKSPIVALCRASLTTRSEIESCIGHREKGTNRTVTVDKIFPAPTPPYEHPAIPDKARETFVALQEMLRERKPAHLIINGCRAVLEASARALGSEGRTLSFRIDDLHKKGEITKTLAEWAHKIRLDGNEAVHEMGGSDEEAREIVNFTRIFLQYVFELPDTIQKARKK